MSAAPTVREALRGLDPAAAGARMLRFAERAFPIPRSITGDGVRETLALMAELTAGRVPIEVHEVPSGTPAFDWTVPREWNVREAWLKGPDGEKVVDFRDSNLHLLGYSVPVRGTFSRAELEEHLFSLPEKPDLVPYRTSYYRESWGFCLPHRQREALPEGDYEVLIDSELKDGSLTYGEVVLPGESDREVLVSCHVCHPSLANDNLSGLAVGLFLAEALARARRRLTHRFVFAPGTIGAIVWLSRNEESAKRIDHGLVAANLGDSGGFHYKKSRRGSAVIDRAVVKALADAGLPLEVEDFVPFGYDERQYGSPGFDLAVGSLTRTPWGRYPEYHTSADDLSLLSAERLAESLAVYLRVAAVLEGNRTFLNTNPKCEPQLGKRGLYRSIGGGDDGREKELALLWVLNQSDGRASLLDIAERSGMRFEMIEEAAGALLGAGLLLESGPSLEGA